MFERVTVGVSDLETSKRFYDSAFAALFVLEPEERGSFVRWDRFAIDAGRPVTQAGHVAFQALTEEVVDSFHAAALAGGGTDNGPPGPRPQYGARVYAAYVHDPDGINVEATYRPLSEWPIDHVVLGVKDLAESKRFYDAVLRPLGRGLIGEFTDAICYGTHDAALWIADREPTAGIELALAAVGPSAVDNFRQAAVDAGFEPKAEPGDAPEYGANQYGAYLVDPDGNDIVAVCPNP